MADRTSGPRKRATARPTTIAVDAQGRNVLCMVYRISILHEDIGIAKKKEFVDAVNAAEGARVYHNDEMSLLFSYKVEAGYADPLKNLVDEDTRVEFAEYKEYNETGAPTLPALE